MNLEDLAEYWASRYAGEVEGDGNVLPALIVAVGKQADIVIADTEDEVGVMASAASLVGMATYPSDAIHVVVIMPSRVAAVDGPTDIEALIGGEEFSPEMARFTPAFVAWAHTIPTGETHKLVLVVHRLDDGTCEYELLPDPGHDETFEPLRFAAHDFDQFAIEDAEGAARQRALGMIEDRNGNGYWAQVHPAGTIATIVDAFVEARDA